MSANRVFLFHLIHNKDPRQEVEFCGDNPFGWLFTFEQRVDTDERRGMCTADGTINQQETWLEWYTMIREMFVLCLSFLCVNSFLWSDSTLSVAAETILLSQSSASKCQHKFSFINNYHNKNINNILTCAMKLNYRFKNPRAAFISLMMVSF